VWVSSDAGSYPDVVWGRVRPVDLSLADFHRITIDDKGLFDGFARRFPVTHSGNLFTTMVCWQEFVQYSVAIVDDHLVISARADPVKTVRPPVGVPSSSLTTDVLRFAVEEQMDLGYVEEQAKVRIQASYPEVPFDEDRDYADYVYKAASLATLPGTKYAKIRNRLNKFSNSTPYTIQPISSETIDDVEEFLDRWCLWKDCAKDLYLEHERRAMKFAIAHFLELGLAGLTLRIKGSVEAISIFEQMNDNTVVVHFEKGSPDYDGVYKAINMETARYVQSHAVYLDREEDLGLPGLRKAKESYHPDHLVRVWHVETAALAGLPLPKD
jgi:uncharacterized protein